MYNWDLLQPDRLTIFETDFRGFPGDGSELSGVCQDAGNSGLSGIISKPSRKQKFDSCLPDQLEDLGGDADRLRRSKRRRKILRKLDYIYK